VSPAASAPVSPVIAPLAPATPKSEVGYASASSEAIVSRPTAGRQASLTEIPNALPRGIDPNLAPVPGPPAGSWTSPAMYPAMRQDQIINEEPIILDSGMMAGAVNSYPSYPPVYGGYLPPTNGAGVIGGIQAVFVKPHLANNLAFTTFDFINSTSQNFNFTQDFNTSWRVWVGLAFEDGVGVRGRYWEYDHNSNPVTLNDPTGDIVFFGPLDGTNGGTGRFQAGFIPDETVVAQSDIDVYSFDLEAYQKVNYRRWQNVVGGGFRYGAISQQYNAFATMTPTFTNNSHRFDGIGPTIMAEVRRPLTSGLAFLASARGSYLFGTTRINNVRNDNGIDNFFNSTEDTAMVVTEFQVGLDYSRTLSNGARFYLALMGDFQSWQQGGNSNSAVGDVDFVGWNVTLGLAR